MQVTQLKKLTLHIIHLKKKWSKHAIILMRNSLIKIRVTNMNHLKKDEFLIRSFHLWTKIKKHKKKNIQTLSSFFFFGSLFLSLFLGLVFLLQNLAISPLQNRFFRSFFLFRWAVPLSFLMFDLRKNNKRNKTKLLLQKRLLL